MVLSTSFQDEIVFHPVIGYGDMVAGRLTLFMVEFQPGGEGNVHDHPFEESYFLLSGEAEAILDGKTYSVKAGDCQSKRVWQADTRQWHN
jgi:quercetin dioxygenase-like cupin family protein